MLPLTMRNPEKENDFKTLKNVQLYSLDVTDALSVQKTLEEIRKNYNKIDVLVNNAGFAIDGVFEGMSDEVIAKQFQTNVFGLMRVTRGALKVMREQNGGTIVQIASMGGRLAFPLYSIYHATKWAVEGFTESLHYEVAPFNIRLKLIEPGAIKTDFYGRSRQFVKPDDTNAYDVFIQKVEKVSMNAGNTGEDPKVVANVILKAANDRSNRLRFPVGKPAPMLLWLRNRIPDTWFFKIVKSTYKL